MKLPLLTSPGMLLISLLTIFWCSCLMLKGSTVKGSVPVSMANMLTPLHTDKENMQKTIYMMHTYKKGFFQILCPVYITKSMIEKARKPDTLRFYHLHGPDVHFGSILPVSKQFRGSVGRTSTLGVEKLQRQRFSLQSVAKAKVCVKHYGFKSETHVEMHSKVKASSAISWPVSYRILHNVKCY